MGENNIKIAQFKRILLREEVIYCDSVIFSYHFHRHPSFVPLTSFLFQLQQEEKITIITSCLSYFETLSLKDLEKEPEKRLLIREFFLSQNNFQICPVDISLAEKAAHIRRSTGLKAVDALHLATAATSLAHVFLTNDKDFRRIPAERFPIVFLDEFTSH